MEKLVLVFVGGGGGAVARYLVGQQALRALGPGWPAGTFIVNVVGGLLMGLLAGYTAYRGGVAQHGWSLFLGVGFLGGFTTFSAFSLDAMAMIERRDYGPAMIYVAASVVLSLAALWVGLVLARRVFA
jgi:fluoride exporter